MKRSQFSYHACTYDNFPYFYPLLVTKLKNNPLLRGCDILIKNPCLLSASNVHCIFLPKLCTTFSMKKLHANY